MGMLRNKDINHATQDNIFYDSYAETLQYYKEYITEVWEEAATICMADTPEQLGLFRNSDIIVVYDNEEGEPMIVTERIYARNYTRREWRRMSKYMHYKLKVTNTELGFNIKVTHGRGYIDYVHYKEEWWQWAQKQKSK